MLIYPAIDLFKGKAVRLYKGDYREMTVYGDPVSFAVSFRAQGAERMHLVDLEGAKTGETPNQETILAIKKRGGLFCEVGGGIRSIETIDRYLSDGIDRVILGSAAVTDPGFVEKAVCRYGEKIAVGIDIRDGFVSVHGWTEQSELEAIPFCRQMESIGVSTLIVTDISKDGAMKGANHALYESLSAELRTDVIASGGVSSLEDIIRLKRTGIHGAIVGKALYTGAMELRQAIEAAL